MDLSNGVCVVKCDSWWCSLYSSLYFRPGLLSHSNAWPIHGVRHVGETSSIGILELVGPSELCTSRHHVQINKQGYERVFSEQCLVSAMILERCLVGVYPMVLNMRNDSLKHLWQGHPSRCLCACDCLTWMKVNHCPNSRQKKSPVSTA